MGKVRCNARGCDRHLWIPKVGQEGRESSAICTGCQQVALCIQHFSVLWKRGTGCPKCKNKQWTVNLFEGESFSPMIQAELIAEGGELTIIDEAMFRAPAQHDPRSGVMMNIAARSQQRLGQQPLNVSAPRPNEHTPDPYYASDHDDSASANGVSTLRGARGHGELPPPPRGWRLITNAELSPQARGLGGGIAIEHEESGQLRMMDDDLIIRHLNIEGEVLSISQAPRKQRLIAECLVGDMRQMLYVRNNDVQGFITNPLSDECEVFGARFINDTSFVVIVERPDGRVDVREGRFKRARQVHMRVIGGSLPATPLPALPFNRGHLISLFKELSGERYLPICRRINGGDDTVIGPEIMTRPVIQAASRDSITVAWSTQGGELWVSSGAQHSARVVDQRGAEHLAISSDGSQVAWSNEWGFFTYHIERQQKEQWSRPHDLIALGWRG